MGWKARRNGRLYYYESKRVGGQARQFYIGPGRVGESAERDAVEARERLRVEREAMWAEERAADAMFRLVSLIAKVLLEAAGWHDPGRNWRRRRRPMATILAEGDGDSRAVHVQVGSKEAVGVLEKIRKGDRSADTLAALRRVVAADPVYIQTITPETFTVSAMLDATYGENSVVGHVTTLEKMDQIKRSLAGPNATALELLLIDRIAFCWLCLYRFEFLYIRKIESGDTSISTHEFAQRRIDRAHRRYLSSIKALASVRRLDLKSLTLALASVNVDLSQNGHPKEG